VGVGKTVAGSWWIWDFVHDWRNWKGRDDCKQFVPKKPVFVTATQLARASRYEDATMDRLLTASRLVIDDLGSEYSDAKGFFRSLLDEVVNVRYSMRRPLLITTNVGPEVFTERYGERIMDRLRECGAFTGIGGPSLRRKPQP
jgi:DNA replication protein DnaC